MDQTAIKNTIFMRTLRRESCERPPIWLLRQAGRYMPEYRAIRQKVSFLELCRNSQLSAEVTVMAVDQLGVDAGIIFADILLPLDAMGVGLRFAAGDGPVIDRPVRASADVDGLPTFEPAEKIDYVLEAIRQFKKSRPECPLIGFAGAPFTLASYLIEGGSSRNFDKTKLFMHKESAAFHKLMAYLARLTVAYLSAQKSVGADCLMLFDSWVGSLSREDYEEYVLPHSQAIFEGIKGLAPAIHFGTNTGGIIDLMASAGGDVIGLDWRVGLADTWARTPSLQNKCVQGNLDPCLLFAEPELIAKRAKLLIDSVGGKPGYIFNLGHGILPGTPVEHVKGLVQFVKSYRPAKGAGAVTPESVGKI
ncbi:MAG: uroporphyrinogen decarboxylase [Cyanobacteria bacterium SZAS LIN-3]|nr:uroporphyrinogen decarboxylase [Cyanobacteria bacterium SZAS LIN-3]